MNTLTIDFERDLTAENFKSIAEQFYDYRDTLSVTEFEFDMKRFSYVCGLLSKYHELNMINPRLILNHIIILHNCFGNFTAWGLYFKCDKQYHESLKSFLVFLSYIPENHPLEKIQSNSEILQVLNEL